MNHRSRSLTQSARGEKCVACCADDGTIVWAHSNEMAHGKGKGIKAHDLLGLYLCFQCHTWYDTSDASRAEKRKFFRENYPITMARVAEKIARGNLKL